MKKKGTQQDDIKNWFDNTYKKRGYWYLRPTKAYYVYPAALKALDGEKLLDVACGLGRLLDAGLRYGLKPFGVDISEVAINMAKKKFPKFNLQVANAENIPFEDSIFDLVTCIGSLERMLDLEQVLSEMKRVGKKDCRYCFLVRNSETNNWRFIKKGLRLKNKKGHQDAKSFSEWKGIFDKAGFTVQRVYPDQYPLFKKIRRRRLWLTRVDYSKLIEADFPIEQANEFMFILTKK